MINKAQPKRLKPLKRKLSINVKNPKGENK